MSERLFQLYERWVLAYPVPILATLFVITALLAWHIPTFKLDASSDSLVLEGDKSLQYFREVSKRYASEEFFVVTYSPDDDLYSDAVLARISALRDELLALPAVSTVTTVLDVPLLNSPKISLADLSDGIKTLRDQSVDRSLAREEFRTSPIYRDLLVSQDVSTTAIQVNLKRDETYIALLESRERLSAALKAQGKAASAEQQQAFDEAFHAFRDYATDFNTRRQALVAEVRSLLDGYRGDATIHLGGVPMIAADMISFVKRDLLVFGSSILVFIIVVLAFIFRELRWVALPLLNCVVAIAAMLGLLAWLDWRMTVVSSNFVALLLIITLSINVHLVVRYRELLKARPERAQKDLVMDTVRLMFQPCLYTALTTVVAFISLVVSGIRPVIDFGWMMTLGILVALALSFIIFPAVLVLLKKNEAATTGADTTAFTLRFADITSNYGGWIVAVATVLAAISAFGVSRLEVENRFIDFFDSETEIYQGMELLDGQLGGTIPMEIILTADRDEDEAVEDWSDNGEDAFADDEEGDAEVDDSADELDASDDFADDFDDEFGDDFGDDFSGQELADTGTASASNKDSYWFTSYGLARVEQVHDYLEAQPETGKVISLATIYKVIRELMGRGVDDIQLAIAQKSLPESMTSVMVRPYLRDELDETRITVRVKETSKELRRNEYLQRVRSHLVDELGFKDENVHITGMLVLYNNMLQSLYRSQILTIAAVFVAILLMFVLLFQSLRLAIIGIVPNVLAAAMVLGGMGLAGIPLDMMTITIAAISIGIGVDNTIHYIHRFRREFGTDRNYLATMYRCHGSIGKAMYYTSSTVIVGFSILALSNFRPSIYFGLLTSIAMLAALLGALMLLPRLLVLLKPLGPEAATGEAAP